MNLILENYCYKALTYHRERKDGEAGYQLISYVIGPNMNSFYQLWIFFCKTQGFNNFETSLENILENGSEYA